MTEQVITFTTKAPIITTHLVTSIWSIESAKQLHKMQTTVSGLPTTCLDRKYAHLELATELQVTRPLIGFSQNLATLVTFGVKPFKHSAHPVFTMLVLFIYCLLAFSIVIRNWIKEVVLC